MKRGSTLFLRAAILLIGLVILAICLFVLPVGISQEDEYRFILVGLYVAAIPFFGALYNAMKLLHYIDANRAFSHHSVRALKHIKYCAVAIWLLFLAGLPLLYQRANADDAPGVLAIGLVIAFASFIIATFAEVLQKLLQNAMEIKAENDLTV